MLKMLKDSLGIGNGRAKRGAKAPFLKGISMFFLRVYLWKFQKEFSLKQNVFFRGGKLEKSANYDKTTSQIRRETVR